ncbi:MAG TPA: DNA polymerase I [Blastocatellia bacterium]|nr:DNA polymerase I [Blastocatellia bacterium]
MAPPPRKRLYLVDGMSQIYRAYYAIRGLSTSSGLPTNAIFGFTNIIRRIISAEKPDYLGVVFDTPEPTFRHESYEKYKATRTKMPDDLTVQVPYIARVCEVLRVPVTRYPGYEADDIIGTFAHEAVRLGLDVVIVTNDKDMAQLVNDHVKLLRADRFGNTYVMDAKVVEEKMGVRPDQVVDLLGLMGDSIDNIPGAPGVGEKGAQQIIKQYGSIENALEHAGELSRKTYRESLTNNVDLIRQSRELVTIKCDVPVKLDLETLIYEEADRRAAHVLFSELEFAQMIREYADAAPTKSEVPETHAPQAHQYSRITTTAALEQFIESLWTLDNIAIGVAERGGALYGLSISTAPGNAVLIDFEQIGPVASVSLLKDVLENGILSKAVHDWKGALTLLDRYVREQGTGQALETNGPLDFQPCASIGGVQDDVMLAAYLADPNRSNYKLPEIAREHLGVMVEDTLEGFEAGDARSLTSADLTYQLAVVLRAKMDSLELESVYREIELPLVEVLFDMEQVGVRIDTARLDSAGQEMDKDLERLTAEIYSQAGQEFNINSPSQLGDIFEKLNFEVGRKTKTGRISTSFDVLEELAAKYELPRLIKDYRELAKLKNTYIEALPKMINPQTGRIHTTLNQAAAATGRLSSTTPNLQNIPIRSEAGRKIRAAFVAAPGNKLISADYSQIELRILAHVTGDTVMTEAFKNGEDIHAATARAVFGAKTKQEEAEHRRVAKIVNFAIAYDIGPFGLAQRTGLSRTESKAVIQNYYNTYTGVRRYMEETPQLVRKSGIVRTIFGRIRPIPDINNRNHNLRGRAEREAINAPIQGTAADLIKIAMIRVNKELAREQLKGRMILQVHDELLLEVPEAEVERTGEIVRREMESAHELAVPLVVDVSAGNNWLEAKP